jgi:hypothetical protein
MGYKVVYLVKPNDILINGMTKLEYKYILCQ